MRISLCIPTYNRAPELRNLLESIESQRDHSFDIEVAISDNASQDDTKALVDAFAQKGMTIVYQRLPENVGFDRNLLNVMSLANGDYCWLFGSDDILEKGAFARLEQVFASVAAPTGVSVGVCGYTPDLAKRIPIQDHISTDFAVQTVLRGRDDIIRGIGPWGLSYISIIIIKREAWNAAIVALPVANYSNGYVHTYVLAALMNAESLWVCVPDRIVGWRSGNEQVVKHNEFSRTKLDIIGYDEALADTLGRNSIVYKAVMKNVATFYIRGHFLNAKFYGASFNYWRCAVTMSLMYYWKYPSFWVKTLVIAFIPRPVFLAVRLIYRKWFKRNKI